MRSEKNKPTAKILSISLLCLAILLLDRQTFSQTPPVSNPKVNSDLDEKTLNKHLAFLQENIREEYKRQNPNLSLIADFYQRIFALTPKTQQGKMAVWESYFIRRRAGNHSDAVGTLQLIYGVYRHDETMLHPMAPETPVNIHATVDIEQADVYSEMSKSQLVGLNQMRMIPLRHQDVYVGIADGERTYFGHVEVVVNLKMAKAHAEAKQYNNAINLFRETIKKHRGESYGEPSGLRDVEWIVVRRFGKALPDMPFGMTKKIVEMNELTALCKSDLAKAEVAFIMAALHEERIEKFHSIEDIVQAEKQYRNVALNFNGVVYPTNRGLEAMGPRAIVRLVGLLTSLTVKLERAVLLLEEIEKSIDRSTKGGNETAAYARLHRAAIFMQKMKNPTQAVYLLENFAKVFPQAVVYPHDEKKPRMLFEIANELRRETRSGSTNKAEKE